MEAELFAVAIFFLQRIVSRLKCPSHWHLLTLQHCSLIWIYSVDYMDAVLVTESCWDVQHTHMQQCTWQKMQYVPNIELTSLTDDHWRVRYSQWEPGSCLIEQSSCPVVNYITKAITIMRESYSAASLDTSIETCTCAEHTKRHDFLQNYDTLLAWAAQM